MLTSVLYPQNDHIKLTSAADLIGICSEADLRHGGKFSHTEVIRNSNFAKWATGKIDFWPYTQDCLIGTRDLTIQEDCICSTPIEGYLSLDFILEGGCDLRLGQRTLKNNAMPRAYLSSHCSNGLQQRQFKRGDSMRGLGLWFKPELLTRDFGLRISDLPAALQSLLTLHSEGTAMFPLTVTMKSVISDIVDMPYTGLMAERYLEAKISELLCHAIQSFIASDKAFASNNDLSQHKSEAVRKALLILNENYVSPPSLEQLAADVGMSRSNFSATFKNSYGISVSDYLLKKRMEQSQLLLQNGKQSVLEVALHVGYNDQSSFARAYKRYFNHSPKMERSGK